jgi:hypothetical protein
MTAYNQGPPALGNVGSYQVSGKPFVSGGIDVSAYTSGPLEITFPSVTRWIVVKNSSKSSDNSKRVLVAASPNGFEQAFTPGIPGDELTGSYFQVNDNYTDNSNPPPAKNYNRQAQTPRLELKLTKLYLSGAADNVDVIAGLTGIPTSTIINNWSGSEGVDKV